MYHPSWCSQPHLGKISHDCRAQIRGQTTQSAYCVATAAASEDRIQLTRVQLDTIYLTKTFILGNVIQWTSKT